MRAKCKGHDQSDEAKTGAPHLVPCYRLPKTPLTARPMFRITPETVDDTPEVEMLFDLAFAPGRTALSSYRLRDDVPPLAHLSCIVRDDYGSLAAAVRYWPVRVGVGLTALLLGPIAVHPTRQGEGVGALLMSETLEKAAQEGWHRVLLVGDLPYYRRFGFQPIDVAFPPPTNPARALGLALKPEGLEGVQGPVRRWDDVPE